MKSLLGCLQLWKGHLLRKRPVHSAVMMTEAAGEILMEPRNLSEADPPDTPRRERIANTSTLR